jgi:uncharacterized protein (TIGR02996 family)
MHDEAGFLSAIRQTPADDTARLVFADWLDEQDDPNCKTKAEFIRLELRMAEMPEQSLGRFRWVKQLQKLATEIDPGWLAVVSHPKLEACRLQFKFECPKQWGGLLPTADAKTRFCGECKKHVHYCETLDEARDHAVRGNCVAVTLALVRRRFDMRPPRPEPPRHIALPRRLRMGRVLPHGIARVGEIRAVPPAVVLPPPAPVPAAETAPEPEAVPESRPKRRKPSKKERRHHRNIQREDLEATE